MKQNLVVVVFALVFTAMNAQHKNVVSYPGGRIAISHDGNNYDKDDYVAAAMDLALLEAQASNRNWFILTIQAT